MIKEKIQGFKERDKVNEKMPKCLTQRFQRIMGLSICTCLFAVIITAASIFGDMPWVQMSFLFLGMGAFVIMFGVFFRYQVLYQGFKRIEGEVTSLNKRFFSGIRREKDKIESFHIVTKDRKIYRIPAIKEMNGLPIHSKVEVFFPVNARISDQDGILRPSVVWGYSIIEEPIAEDLKHTIKEEEESFDKV